MGRFMVLLAILSDKFLIHNEPVYVDTHVCRLFCVRACMYFHFKFFVCVTTPSFVSLPRSPSGHRMLGTRPV